MLAAGAMQKGRVVFYKERTDHFKDEEIFHGFGGKQANVSYL